MPATKTTGPETSSEPGEDAWQKALAGLEASQKALRETVAGLADAALGQNVPGKDMTTRRSRSAA